MKVREWEQEFDFDYGTHYDYDDPNPEKINQSSPDRLVAWLDPKLFDRQYPMPPGYVECQRCREGSKREEWEPCPVCGLLSIEYQGLLNND